ncbi:UDP-N-acetyl-D-mannosamine dehydrogenase [Gammaproteobacteria bacterium]|nr:UDP-N-acetyl-D-mannosamine dehydrogenase [Gammaproteobacteria bacterium]
MKKKVSVIGLGYIGLPTAALLASEGFEVMGMDLSQDVVDTINRGEIQIVEPDLDAYVRSAVARGLLKAATDVSPADVYILCVPTPFHLTNGEPTANIDYVLTAAKSISSHIKAGDIIILESTSPVGTTALIKNVLADEKVNVDEIYIAYCAERVIPGKIMVELVQNDRVIGGVNKESTKAIADFYSNFVQGDILQTDAKTAEMCKLTENSFRDVNIAFANELSMICANSGVDVWELIKLANHHPRVNILAPGTGVGGHCIAVDPWFIVSSDRKNSKLIRQAREVNDSKPNWVVEHIVQEAKYLKKDHPKITCLGLSFKPDTDDLRGSPASIVVKSLMDIGLDVSCVEPNIQNHSNFFITSFDEAIKNSDVIAILVGHKEFKSEANKELLRNIKVMDFCGVLS